MDYSKLETYAFGIVYAAAVVVLVLDLFFWRPM